MRYWQRLIAGLFFLGCAGIAHADTPKDSPPGAEPLPNALALLKDKNFRTKAEGVGALEASGDPRALVILRAYAEGSLYQSKADDGLVIGTERDGQFSAADAISGAAVAAADKSAYTKVPLNNALRAQLKGALARLSLGSGDAAERLTAVRAMLKEMTPEAAELLRNALIHERDATVHETMTTALALVDVGASDPIVRLNAVTRLSTSLEPEARARLQQLLLTASDGSHAEPDAAVRQAASRALASIETKLKLYELSETVFFGLSLGSVLLLSAIGLTITFGVMGVINMAHGELMMLGAYTTYVVQLLMPNHIDASLFVAVPAAFLVAGLAGIAIERGVIRFLYGRPLETLLATFGVSLVLQQLVRTLFSPLNRSVATPSWMSGSWQFNSALSLTYNRIYIVVFSLLVFAALLLLLKRSVFGLQVRAVAQNRDMAQAMGIRTPWVDALTFGLGSGIAGVAGVALSQLTNVGPNLGQSYIIDSFMVVVFGGVGNLWGMLVGAFSLGVVNKFLEPWAGAVLAKILVLVFIILFIQKRPRGLFPQKGRAAEA